MGTVISRPPLLKIRSMKPRSFTSFSAYLALTCLALGGSAGFGAAATFSHELSDLPVDPTV